MGGGGSAVRATFANNWSTAVPGFSPVNAVISDRVGPKVALLRRCAALLAVSGVV